LSLIRSKDLDACQGGTDPSLPYRLPAAARRAGRLVLVLSLVAIVAIVVPWRSVQSHPHWARIGWLPFVSPPLRPFDIVANVALFAPLGAGAALACTRGVRAAAGVALAVSLLGETVQVFAHSRFPSATDVACNVGGAILGALVTRQLMHRNARSGQR
jgi:glycopeptide antibiotics resistance protein